jgi:hypothetical protein
MFVAFYLAKLLMQYAAKRKVLRRTTTNNKFIIHYATLFIREWSVGFDATVFPVEP